MKAIDLDEAIERFLQAGNMSKDQVIYMLNRIPTTEIVRCGECKHLMPDGRCREFADDAIRPSASDFCSYGKRREE